jgi:serine/threonine-protein kinase haspin
VDTAACVVTRGPYAPALLKAWKVFEATKGSENEYPASLPADQLYCVFVLSDGGTDLEGFELSDAEEAKALLLQVTLSLAVAEEACEFEHRDLHWGNVLLARQPGAPDARHTLRGVRLAAQTAGLRVTLIDFTLSRMAPRHGDVAFCDLEADPELFGGPKAVPGDCQAETYRRMRKAVSRDWSAFVPRTNALWLHYLADLLLHKKQLRDGRKLERRERRELTAFALRCRDAYARAGDALDDPLFAGMWHALKPGER